MSHNSRADELKRKDGTLSTRLEVKLDRDGQLRDMDVSEWMRSKFRAAEFGDKRLTNRLIQLKDELGKRAAESIPTSCEDWASTKAYIPIWR
ncbi:MAG: hypothetical protein J07HQW1_02505 [Haloquadratum walsbyi J07HQW1]|uniref:Transposase Tn5-like N-terminal domain-containing protein n=1 Tax=Haloquadratum walsbyi J07HQW1 TaxID=1238424 RepID=U1PJV5_9EURY|nr:MAG: hypothetical protein J07HQW1_02505 [Haloquadratum walsbyi J07HQW1]